MTMNRETQEQIWAVALDQASKGDSTMFDRLVAETGAAFKTLSQEEQEALLKKQRDSFKTGPRGERQARAWTQDDVDAMSPGQKRLAEKIRGIAEQWAGGTGGVYTINAMAHEMAVRLWDDPLDTDERQELQVLRRQRMAPERERELLEASNRHLQAERDISRAYLRLRSMIPGALDTPYAPTPEQVWEITETALAANLRVGDPWIDRCAWIATQMLSLIDYPGYGERDALGISLAHQIWMLKELAAKRVGSGTKSCRWLGWAQAALVMKNLLSLDQCKDLVTAAEKAVPAPQDGSFQDRNLTFIEMVAGDDATDLEERRDRFGEEALELLQATGLGKQAAHELVNYVWSRPIGEPAQEMGGTMVTLAGLASFAGLDMAACGEAELTRCNTPEVVAKIRAKRASRVRGSVLPGTLT